MTDPPINLEEERRRAYNRVKYHFPSAKTLICKDCGNSADGYDHPFGYGKNWDKVEPVCFCCHTKREKARGRRVGNRKRKGLIGPKLQNGDFYSNQEKNRLNYYLYRYK